MLGCQKKSKSTRTRKSMKKSKSRMRSKRRTLASQQGPTLTLDLAHHPLPTHNLTRNLSHSVLRPQGPTSRQAVTRNPTHLIRDGRGHASRRSIMLNRWSQRIAPAALLGGAIVAAVLAQPSLRAAEPAAGTLNLVLRDRIPSATAADQFEIRERPER